MTNCPYPCPTRCVGCQIACPISQAHEAEKQARYAQQQRDFAVRDVHIQAVIKAERKKHLAYS